MKIFMFLIMCMIAASAIAAQQAGKHEIQITCSKPDHRFKCGEKVYIQYDIIIKHIYGIQGRRMFSHYNSS